MMDTTPTTTIPIIIDTTTTNFVDGVSGNTTNQIIDSTTNNRNLFFDDDEDINCIQFTEDQTINLVLTGGGGAGGIGIYDPNSTSTCYVYGGGGSAGETISRMINVKAGEEFIINVGKGGISNDDINGGDTIITYTKLDGTIEVIRASGGINGNPKMDIVETILNQDPDDNYDLCSDGIIDGGKLDDSCVCDPECNQLCGNGIDGGIAVPSINVVPGSGGQTIFTGIGGAAGQSDNPTGGDGTLGSGGGGSMPLITEINDNKLSGNGGSGYVRIDMMNPNIEDAYEIIRC